MIADGERNSSAVIVHVLRWPGVLGWIPRYLQQRNKANTITKKYEPWLMHSILDFIGLSRTMGFEPSTFVVEEGNEKLAHACPWRLNHLGLGNL